MFEAIAVIFLVILAVVLWSYLGYYFEDTDNDTAGSAPYEWPILAETHDRNEAYMIKALLDDANIECIVEEDTTLGVLYGLQSITKYPIRVPEQKFKQSKGLLKESSFSDQLVSEDH